MLVSELECSVPKECLSLYVTHTHASAINPTHVYKQPKSCSKDAIIMSRNNKHVFLVSNYQNWGKWYNKNDVLKPGRMMKKAWLIENEDKSDDCLEQDFIRNFS